MKFCNMCGNQMEDQATFCPICGAASEAAPAPAQQAPAANPVNDIMGKVQDFGAQAANFGQNYVQAAKKDKKLWAIAAGAIVAAILVIWGLIALLGGGGYKQPIDDMIDMQMGKASKAQIKRMFPKEMIEEADLDMDDYWDEYKDSKEDMLEELEDQFGKNVKISYKITDKEKWDKDDLEEAAELLNEAYDIKESKVKAAYELEIEMKIKGRDDSDETETTLNVIKIGSKWYIYEMLMFGGMMF